LILDTGVVVAALDRDDGHHDACASLLSAASGATCRPFPGAG
jgi:predicted nucleic acid-binding protein